MKYPRTRRKIHKEIYDIIYNLSYNAEGVELIDKHYCIAEVATQRIVNILRNTYRRRTR
jgi:hypothetical protein